MSPNKTSIQASHTCLLDLPCLPCQARQAHLFPKLAHSLLSVGLLCNHGCTVLCLMQPKSPSHMRDKSFSQDITTLSLICGKSCSNKPTLQPQFTLPYPSKPIVPTTRPRKPSLSNSTMLHAEALCHPHGYRQSPMATSPLRLA
jgi:hypothetical protein